MARKKIIEERKALIKGIIAEYQPTTAGEAQGMLKDLLGDTLQELLESELEDELGYSKYDYINKETDNHRNGYSKKNVISSMGEIQLNVPRDRKGEFEPQVVKKRQTDISRKCRK